MAFKVNIGEKGKTFHIDTESEALIGKSIGETIEGSEVAESLAGYEFKISGASDKAGFPAFESVEGPALKRVLLTRGKGMWTKGSGLRLRKTVRGKVISPDTVQINLLITKQGSKKLAEIFPDQVMSKKEKEAAEKKAEAAAKKAAEKAETAPAAPAA